MTLNTSYASRIAVADYDQWKGRESIGLSIRKILKLGSYFEDVPNPRARHHFLDPIHNSGLDNLTILNYVTKKQEMDAIFALSLLLYPDYAVMTTRGYSAYQRAETESTWFLDPKNCYTWNNARLMAYKAITEYDPDLRKTEFASVFLDLGHVLHLYEDMGVPAHARNDFVDGHMISGLINQNSPVILSKGGLKSRLKRKIGIPLKFMAPPLPSQFYNSEIVNIAFNTFKNYWDAEICNSSGSQGSGGPPSQMWGLAECTNYQFMSFSTVFSDSILFDSSQRFPHPSKDHANNLFYQTVDGKHLRFRSGYNVNHLTRKAWLGDDVENAIVYNDYAQITLARTVDYTAGIINFFFRGKLSVSQALPYTITNGTILIRNVSKNTDKPQILKGGTFELYWDDYSDHRTLIPSFQAYTDMCGTTHWQPGDSQNPGSALSLSFYPS